MLKTPVLFLVFNRPHETAKVFEAIRQARPERLYIACDGPREDRLDETKQCQEVRDIVQAVDWGGEIKTLFRSQNLGCRKAVSQAIDWFFDHEPEGIILEDDCLPSPSFFPYCEELLIKYRGDSRIVQVSGFNPVGPGWSTPWSYVFSRFGPTWGWATWRRAWDSYDVDMASWPEVREGKIYEAFTLSAAEAKWRRTVFDRTYQGEIGTWDYQWSYTKCLNSGLIAIPSRNLIRNIGFGPNATHTTEPSTINRKNQEISDLQFPLNHPQWVLKDPVFDHQYLRQFVGLGRPLPVRLLRRFKAVFRKLE